MLRGDLERKANPPCPPFAKGEQQRPQSDASLFRPLKFAPFEKGGCALRRLEARPCLLARGICFCLLRGELERKRIPPAPFFKGLRKQTSPQRGFDRSNLRVAR